MQMKGAKIVMEALIEQGVDLVFGYPGGTVIDIYDQLYQYSDRIRHVLCSHEQGGTHAADGYSRATGKTGVMIATSGPGATNVVTGIATAYMDSIPLIVLTGNVSVKVMGQDNFQEVDIVGTTLGIVKHSYRVHHIEELADTIREAFFLAADGRPGPVLIDIPKDVQQDVCEFTPRPRAVPGPHEPECSWDDIERAAEMMERSRRPLIYAGGGAKTSGALENILELSRRLDAPISCSLMAADLIPYDTARYLGMSGMHGLYASTKAISECDLMICVGGRFSDRTVGDPGKFAEKARIIHIDVDPAEIDKMIQSDLQLVGDANEVLECLLMKTKGASRPEWMAEIESMKEYGREHGFRWVGDLDPYFIIDTVSDMLPGDCPVVTDVGQHQMWVAQRYRFKQPRTFLSSGGFGTMGFGMGAALGAAIGTGKRSVLFTGDGSFAMDMCEFGTAVTEKAPVIVVVMNNGVLGMVREQQQFFTGSRYSATDTNRKTDFAAIAAAFGGLGLTADTPEGFKEAFAAALQTDGPVVIDCHISREEMVYPMVPPNGSVETILMPEE